MGVFPCYEGREMYRAHRGIRSILADMTTTGKLVFGGAALLLAAALLIMINRGTVESTVLENEITNENQVTPTAGTGTTTDKGEAQASVKSTKESTCEKQGGTWDAAAGECTGVDEASCTAIGGTFDECASPCRNDPDAEACIQMCVAVCALR
jgi:CubicO group peptidase (beta-lactamase class C family)